MNASDRPYFKVTAEVLEPWAVEALVAHPAAGGIATFQGVVRDNTDGAPTTCLEYEAYPAMAVAEMARIADEASSRWPGIRAAAVHRTGRLEIGEASVIIAVSAPHRAEALAACQYFIDELKERVPVWKKEFSPDGSHWVEGPRRIRSDGGPDAAVSARSGSGG